MAATYKWLYLCACVGRPSIASAVKTRFDGNGGERERARAQANKSEEWRNRFARTESYRQRA